MNRYMLVLVLMLMMAACDAPNVDQPVDTVQPPASPTAS